jgi:hypothetical protein
MNQSMSYYMPITTDNRSRPLYAYNQLFRDELPQVTRPANICEPRFFLYGDAVYDKDEFKIDVEFGWKAEGRLAIQLCLYEGRPGVIVGRIS